MKLLHVSDLHIGKRLMNMSLAQDQRHILSQIARIAQERSVDALLVAGDIYDKAVPSADAVTMLDSFLTQMVNLGIPVLAIPGNHDSAERVAYVQGLLEHHGVSFSPVYDGSLKKVRLEDAYGPVDVWLIPFLKPGDVRRFFPEKDLGDSYTAALEAVLGACPIDENVRNVAVSHQLVTALGKEPDRADDEIRLGGVDNVDYTVYAQFDYVALGHVHRPQRVGRDTVRYSGSPLKYSQSEARFAKSAVVVSLGEKAAGAQAGDCASFELVPLEPLHDVREVRMPLDDVLALGGTEGAAGQDYVHVVLTDEHPKLDALSKVRDVYPNMLALEYECSLAEPAQQQAPAVENPEEVDMATLFAWFFEEQTGTALDDEQLRLVGRAVEKAELQGTEAAR